MGAIDYTISANVRSVLGAQDKILTGFNKIEKAVGSLSKSEKKRDALSAKQAKKNNDLWGKTTKLVRAHRREIRNLRLEEQKSGKLSAEKSRRLGVLKSGVKKYEKQLNYADRGMRRMVSGGVAGFGRMAGSLIGVTSAVGALIAVVALAKAEYTDLRDARREAADVQVTTAQGRMLAHEMRHSDISVNELDKIATDVAVEAKIDLARVYDILVKGQSARGNLSKEAMIHIVKFGARREQMTGQDSAEFTAAIADIANRKFGATATPDQIDRVIGFGVQYMKLARQISPTAATESLAKSMVSSEAGGFAARELVALNATISKAIVDPEGYRTATFMGRFVKKMMEAQSGEMSLPGGRVRGTGMEGLLEFRDKVTRMSEMQYKKFAATFGFRGQQAFAALGLLRGGKGEDGKYVDKTGLWGDYKGFYKRTMPLSDPKLKDYVKNLYPTSPIITAQTGLASAKNLAQVNDPSALFSMVNKQVSELFRATGSSKLVRNFMEVVRELDSRPVEHKLFDIRKDFMRRLGLSKRPVAWTGMGGQKPGSPTKPAMYKDPGMTSTEEAAMLQALKAINATMDAVHQSSLNREANLKILIQEMRKSMAWPVSGPPAPVVIKGVEGLTPVDNDVAEGEE